MRYNPTVKARALARYKRRKTDALAIYNANIVAVWDAYNRPSTSAECKLKLRGVWDAYVAALQAAGRAYDEDLMLAELLADVLAAVKAFGLSGVELSQMGLA